MWSPCTLINFVWFSKSCLICSNDASTATGWVVLLEDTGVGVAVLWFEENVGDITAGAALGGAAVTVLVGLIETDPALASDTGRDGFEISSKLEVSSSSSLSLYLDAISAIELFWSLISGGGTRVATGVDLGAGSGSFGTGLGAGAENEVVEMWAL